METPGAALLIADRLKQTYKELSDARGELAEILKAEVEAKVRGIENSYETTITARRKDGDLNALEYTKESIDWKAKVDILTGWVTFYSLLLRTGLYINVSDI